MRAIASLVVLTTFSGCIVINNATPNVTPAPAGFCPAAITVLTDTSWSPSAVAAAGNTGWSRDMIPDATWIWRDRTPNGESACLSRRFEIPSGCGNVHGSIVVGIDDQGSVRINGAEVLQYGGWSHPSASVDVTNALHVGDNLIEICATNWSAPGCQTEECNPAGVLARLDVTFTPAQESADICTDEDSCE